MAILLYHTIIILTLVSSGSRVAWQRLRRGWSSRPGFCLAAVCAAAGPALYLLWHLIAHAPDALAADLDRIGLSGPSWLIFVAYFVSVHPCVEEAFWRGCFGSDSRRPALVDVAFGGYHLLVLPLFVNTTWALICLTILVLTAWLWRWFARTLGGLAVPVVSHAVADLSLMIAVVYLR